MRIMITGGAGFIGQRLARTLIRSSIGISFEELYLVDIILPDKPFDDRRVRCRVADLSQLGTAEELFSINIDIVYHLAAVVSGGAEENFDLGMSVNFDATRNLLEALRNRNPSCKFIFTSSVGVFGGQLPKEVTELTAVTPVSSYGAQKAMCELLINDYTRKGFIDGRILRLPTISVRPGTPNKAVTSFVSGIIREPLNGLPAVCPVSKNMGLWISSPETVVKNLIFASTLSGTAIGMNRIINLPGIKVTVQEMVDALIDIAGQSTAGLIYYEHNEVINRIVTNVPCFFNVERALTMGFHKDSNVHQIIQSYIDFDLKPEPK